MAATGLEVIREMVERTNAHDLEGMAALMHKDYQSEQPFHPARGFGGRAQMKANWAPSSPGSPTCAPRSRRRCGMETLCGASGTGGARPRSVSRSRCVRSPSSRCGRGLWSAAGFSRSLSSREAPASTTLSRRRRATAHGSRADLTTMTFGTTSGSGSASGTL